MSLPSVCECTYAHVGQYCMPAEGVALSPAEGLLTLSEMERLVCLFAGHGVRKVRLTGGEPLVRRDIVDIVGEIV